MGVVCPRVLKKGVSMTSDCKPVLVVLAAGMGSRYGGLKQIDPVGPHGEIIIDYSLYDAYRAGFRKVVFIINHRIEQDFMDTIGKRAAALMETDFVFQELDACLPEGASVPEGRKKPWGTAHAILCCMDKINGPFAVINSDDYYGVGAYRVLYDRLTRCEDRNGVGDYAMVGFRLKNTLTEHGSVARGVCETDSEGRLTAIMERTRIAIIDGHPAFTENGTDWTELPEDNLVSMNMWGLTPSVLTAIKERFVSFMKEEVPANPEKSEMYIPMEVSRLLKSGKCTVDVLSSADRWYGVTYKEDKPSVAAAMKKLTEQGVYPDRPLF